MPSLSCLYSSELDDVTQDFWRGLRPSYFWKTLDLDLKGCSLEGWYVHLPQLKDTSQS